MQSPEDTNYQNPQNNPSEDTDRKCGQTCNESGKATSNESKVVDEFANVANQILDVISWLGQKLNSSGNVFRMEDAKGALAEVSTPIPRGGVGEVTVIVGQTRKNYSAKAVRPEEEFNRGTRVRIAEVGVSTMYVEAIK